MLVFFVSVLLFAERAHSPFHSNIQKHANTAEHIHVIVARNGRKNKNYMDTHNRTDEPAQNT